MAAMGAAQHRAQAGSGRINSPLGPRRNVHPPQGRGEGPTAGRILGGVRESLTTHTHGTGLSKAEALCRGTGNSSPQPPDFSVQYNMVWHLLCCSRQKLVSGRSLSRYKTTRANLDSSHQTLFHEDRTSAVNCHRRYARPRPRPHPHPPPSSAAPAPAPAPAPAAMVNNAVVIPVAVLASVCVCMFAFVCWWFPRAWQRGINEDTREVDARIRQRELQAELGEVTTSEEGDAPGGGGAPGGPKMTQARTTYVPPVTPY